jgi:hypothetical protein
MKILPCLTLFLLLALHAAATTFYVNANNSAPGSPFTTWSTAATNIQDAIDVTTNGDTVLVTNGVYAFGGKVMAGDLTNRVALTNTITVQSVNGPWVTTILGAGATNGTSAVRCAWLTNGASLIGFTLMRGATRNSGDTISLESGGGIWCASSNAVVANCVIVSNTAYYYGGGVYRGTVINSFISTNGCSYVFGGAANGSVLKNCTIVSNAAYGVVSPLAMTNCIIYYNGSQNFSASGNAFSHCCTTPLLSGSGNFTTAPQLFWDNVHLLTNSTCIGAGVNIATGTDIFGNSWSNPPAVGCAEWTPMPLVSAPQIKLNAEPVGFTVGNVAVGSPSACSFAWYKDGVLLSDNGHFTGTQTTNLTVAGVSLADVGNYQVVISNSFGVVTSAVVTTPMIHCVDVAGTNPTTPFSSWATAATNIQDAITVAAADEIILVTNGLYSSGGKSMDGLITNCVSVDKTVLVQSVNGANATVIQGAWDPTSTNGPGAIRCAWMTTNAILGGFTLRGGATHSNVSGSDTLGGGVCSITTNATVANCVIKNNAAATAGGGASKATLINCLLVNNSVLGVPGYGITVYGGGASGCSLKGCIITGNCVFGIGTGAGGGTAYGSLKNCAVIGNSAVTEAGGVYSGTLINCTVTKNLSLSAFYDYGGGAAFATLTNCIVYGNGEAYTSGVASNFYNCTFSYSCSSPLPSGTGNTGANPQLLADGAHLAASSPCIGAGSVNAVSGTDIDGQPWNNPPSIGCDEWLPAPVIGAQPTFQIGVPAHGLTFSVVVAGQTPFAYFWSKDGVPIQDDGHHNNSGTANLIVNNFGPDDAGIYQVVVTNSSGTITSAVAQVVIHAVNVAGANPAVPYSSWANAATNIQDAINIAVAGDIVLVTNGIYATGGMVMASNLTNRVALSKAITVVSVNGYQSTIIQGAWDPVATNGPGAVRCAWLTDGAVLCGFTLQNGATRATGDVYVGGPLESGGGAWCSSTNGIISNCQITNNSAISGGGIANGTLNNSLVVGNYAFSYGGGAYSSTLNNCTVVNNYAVTGFTLSGAGTYNGITRNSIVVGNNSIGSFGITTMNNYQTSPQYSYCCTAPTLYQQTMPSGTGNTNVNPQFLDLSHIAAASPCRGAGSGLYTSGTDLDGEPWNSPPSMGCDEIVLSNLTGPLAVSIFPGWTNGLVNRTYPYWAAIAGRAASATWSFGDGPIYTNFAAGSSHQWTNGGDYTVTATVFNNDNLAGISGNLLVHFQSLAAPQLQTPTLLTNGFQFQFAGQYSANYTIQYATSLIPPITWQTLQTIYFSSQSMIQINDASWTNGMRFYRVLAQ